MKNVKNTILLKSICKIYKDVSLTEWPVEDHWSFSKHKDSDQVETDTRERM